MGGGGFGGFLLGGKNPQTGAAEKSYNVARDRTRSVQNSENQNTANRCGGGETRAHADEQAFLAQAGDGGGFEGHVGHRGDHDQSPARARSDASGVHELSDGE